MAFLATFALALALATGRLADRWASELAASATIRISAPQTQLPGQTAAALAVLATTPGVATAEAISFQAQRELLAPWFGSAVPVEDLPLPQLIAITEEGDGFDARSLTLRLAAEVPGAVLDDHGRWRRPLVRAAGGLRVVGWVSLGLIALATAALITLAASAALAANRQVIAVLRQVGASDLYIAQAFVRRFTWRGFAGAGLGTFGALVVILVMPKADDIGGFLTGLGFQGWGWIAPLCIPILAGLVAFGATYFAAMRMLRGLQ